MAAIQVVNWRVRPGRKQEFAALVAEAKAFHERLGGRVRVFQATFAGENANNFTYVIEHVDMSALGKFAEELQTESEWQALIAKAFTTDPTGTLLSNSIANAITP